MRTAYVTTYNSSDVHAWSGLGTHILGALQDSGFQTEIIANLKQADPPRGFRFKKALYSKLLSRKYLLDREPAVLKNYADQVAVALKSMDCDLVFSPGTMPIAYLETRKPIVFWTDATFAGMIDFYPGFSNLCAESIRDGNRMEQSALSKCRLALYASEWAANTAIQHYDVDPAKVKVIPFGANINCNRNMQDIETLVQGKHFDICKLLFVGVDWIRKGGELALKVVELLNQRGIRSELHLVGCDPGIRLPSFVKSYGFLSKKTEEGRRTFDRLMSESHFFILPSRAECYGLVFAEASSFGLPSLATNVGGIPTVVQDGKNGRTFPLDADPEQYCDYIERLISSRQEYDALSRSSFREYSERLNWGAAGRKVYDLIRESCG